MKFKLIVLIIHGKSSNTCTNTRSWSIQILRIMLAFQSWCTFSKSKMWRTITRTTRQTNCYIILNVLNSWCCEFYDRIGILITMEDKPGALNQALQILSSNNINLTSIHSVPPKTVEKEKTISISLDFQGSFEDDNVKMAMS